MSRLHLHHPGALLGSILVAVLLVGCGEEPTPPRLIRITPAALSVPADQTLAVGVEYEENDFALNDFQWLAAAGAIEGDGAPSIIYHAPEQPGDYRIAVTVRYGDAATPLSLDSTIHVTAAVGGAGPAVAQAPEPEGPPGEPTEFGWSARHRAGGDCRCDQREHGWRSGRGRAGGRQSRRRIGARTRPRRRAGRPAGRLHKAPRPPPPRRGSHRKQRQPPPGRRSNRSRLRSPRGPDRPGSRVRRRQRPPRLQGRRGRKGRPPGERRYSKRAKPAQPAQRRAETGGRVRPRPARRRRPAWPHRPWHRRSATCRWPRAPRRTRPRQPAPASTGS